MTSRRTFTTFPVDDIGICKQQLLNWLGRFSSCCFLDNHGYAMPGGRYECVAGAGQIATLRLSAGGAFDALQAFHALHDDWLFGHLGYDLKNELEDLSSTLPDPGGFPDLHFFVPEYVLLLSQAEVRIGTVDGAPAAAEVWQQIRAMPLPSAAKNSIDPDPALRARFSQTAYLETVQRLQEHIHRGDCYEITFCQEYFMEDVGIDPLATYKDLAAVSPMPHCAYYTFGDHYLLCASPERYLQLQEGRLLSQPIKGTIGRQMDDPAKDRQMKERLLASPKEKSENVMIVDLVRNDLSRICTEGSVRATELWGIYAFPQVYQMISSVEGVLAPEHTWIDALKATFPMGSMTGAPKKRVMELIDHYERTRRGLYSGAVGYIDPEGNFDFGVVIRSILYNRARRYLSFSVGSAITAASEPEAEYAECLVKAGAIKKALGRSLPSA